MEVYKQFIEIISSNKGKNFIRIHENISSFSKLQIFIAIMSLCLDRMVDNHTMEQDGPQQISQRFPYLPKRSMLMKPCIPHHFPQLFFTIQKLVFSSQYTPVTNTAWFSQDSPHWSSTPSQQYMKFGSAAMATVTGLFSTIPTRLSQSYSRILVYEYPLILNSPLRDQHPPSFPQTNVQFRQGYFSYRVSPFIMAKAKTLDIHPPLHPSFPKEEEQSTICCYDKSTFLPFIRQEDQTSAMAANAQHEPHAPCSFTYETMPLSVQFTFLQRAVGKYENSPGDDGLGDGAKTCMFLPGSLYFPLGILMSIFSESSSKVYSMNSLQSFMVKALPYLELCQAIHSRLRWATMSRQATQGVMVIGSDSTSRVTSTSRIKRVPPDSIEVTKVIKYWNDYAQAYESLRAQVDLLRLTRMISTWLFSSMSFTSVHLMNLDLLVSPSFPRGISTLRCSKLERASSLSPPIEASTLASLLLFIITVLPSNRFSFCSLQQLSLHRLLRAVSPMKLPSSSSTFSWGHCPLRRTGAQSSVRWLWESSNWSRQGKFMLTRDTTPLFVMELLMRLRVFKPRHLLPSRAMSPLLPRQLKLRLSFSSFLLLQWQRGCMDSASMPLSLRERSLSSARRALARACTPRFLMLLLARVRQRTLSQLALQNSMSSSSPRLQRSMWMSSTLLGSLKTLASSRTACMSITQSSLSRQWNLFSLYMMQFLEVQLVNFRLTSPPCCTRRMQRIVLSIEFPIEAVRGIPSFFTLPSPPLPLQLPAHRKGQTEVHSKMSKVINHTAQPTIHDTLTLLTHHCSLCQQSRIQCAATATHKHSDDVISFSIVVMRYLAEW